MTNENKKIAVLLPCYNEALTVEKVIKDYKEAFPTADIYVYDNNSTDGTGEIARKAGAIVKKSILKEREMLFGRCFKDIDADCYIMDRRGTHESDPSPEMADMILRGEAEMVIGDRLSSTYFTENKRLFHNTGNRMVRGLINTLFDVHVTDIMTGSRAFSYTFVKTFPVLSKGFEIETEMTIHAAAHNLRMVEVPTNYRDRPEGSESKLNTYSDGAKVLGTIARLFKEYKPMAFFGLVCLDLFDYLDLHVHSCIQ